MTDITHIDQIADGATQSDEAITEAVNSHLNAIFRELDTIMENYSDRIRPQEAGDIAEVAYDYMHLASSLGGPQALARLSYRLAEREDGPNFLADLQDEALGNIMLHMPITESARGTDPEARVNRKLALAAADALGPDWAQAWYKFIVLVTKLA